MKNLSNFLYYSQVWLFFVFLCYLEFYPHCDVYYPPLTWECIVSLWRDVFGCNENGTGYPGLLDDEYGWTNKNLRWVPLQVACSLFCHFLKIVK